MVPDVLESTSSCNVGPAEIKVSVLTNGLAESNPSRIQTSDNCRAMAGFSKANRLIKCPAEPGVYEPGSNVDHGSPAEAAALTLAPIVPGMLFAESTALQTAVARPCGLNASGPPAAAVMNACAPWLAVPVNVEDAAAVRNASARRSENSTDSSEVDEADKLAKPTASAVLDRLNEPLATIGDGASVMSAEAVNVMDAEAAAAAAAAISAVLLRAVDAVASIAEVDVAFAELDNAKLAVADIFATPTISAELVSSIAEVASAFRPAASVAVPERSD